VVQVAIFEIKVFLKICFSYRKCKQIYSKDTF